MARRLTLAAIAAFALLAPAGLALRALADEWRAPALLPQRLGWRGIDAIASDPALRGAVLTSLTAATIVMVLAFPLAWPAARAIAARTSRTAPLVTVLALPLLVPGYAVGSGIAAWLIRLGLPGGLPAIVIAHLPFVLAYEILVLAPALDGRVARLEEAAAVLGADPPRRLAFVTLPSVSGAVASALFVGFTVSLTQYGSTLAVGAGTATLPILLVPFAQSDPQIAAALSLLLLLPALIAITLSRVGQPAATNVG